MKKIIYFEKMFMPLIIVVVYVRIYMFMLFWGRILAFFREEYKFMCVCVCFENQFMCVRMCIQANPNKKTSKWAWARSADRTFPTSVSPCI